MAAEDRTPAGEPTVTVESPSGLLEKVPSLDGATSISTSQKEKDVNLMLNMQEYAKPEASQAVMGLLKLGLTSSLRPQQPIGELNNKPHTIVKKHDFETLDGQSSMSAEVHQDGPGECLSEQSRSLIGKAREDQIGETSPVKEEIGVAAPQGESREEELNSGQLSRAVAATVAVAPPVKEEGSMLPQPTKKKKRTKDQAGKDSNSVGSDWGVPKAYIRRTMKSITSDNMLLSRDVLPLVGYATEKFLSWFISSCAEVKQKEPEEKIRKIDYGDVSDVISNGGGKLGFLSFVVPPPLP